MGLLRTILACWMTGSLKELLMKRVAPICKREKYKLEMWFLFIKIERGHTSVALKVSKPIDEGRISANMLVAGRNKVAILNHGSLVVDTAFSIHPWHSCIWNTDHFCMHDTRGKP